MPLSNPEKRALKARAQRLEPILHVGKNGLSEPFLKSADEALSHHGLVKIKFAGFKEQKRELAQEIVARTASELIQIVGHVAVIYRAETSPASSETK